MKKRINTANTMMMEMCMCTCRMCMCTCRMCMNCCAYLSDVLSISKVNNCAA